MTCLPLSHMGAMIERKAFLAEEEDLQSDMCGRINNEEVGVHYSRMCFDRSAR